VAIIGYPRPAAFLWAGWRPRPGAGAPSGTPRTPRGPDLRSPKSPRASAFPGAGPVHGRHRPRKKKRVMFGFLVRRSSTSTLNTPTGLGGTRPRIASSQASIRPVGPGARFTADIYVRLGYHIAGPPFFVVINQHGGRRLWSLASIGEHSPSHRYPTHTLVLCCTAVSGKCAPVRPSCWRPPAKRRKRTRPGCAGAEARPRPSPGAGLTMPPHAASEDNNP